MPSDVMPMRLDTLLEGSPAYVVLFRRSGFEDEFNELATEAIETLSDQCEVILLVQDDDCDRLFIAPLKEDRSFDPSR